MTTMITTRVEGGPEVCRIVLPSGHVALVDEADRELVEQYRWFVRRNKGKLYVRGYARFGHDGRGPGTNPPANVHLHRLILGVPTGVEVDHINGDGLDNRRCNLRPATRAQNVRNTRNRANSSGYKGVSWDPINRKWRAKIGVDGFTRCLGRFEDPWEAALAYNAAALEAWGEYAWLNERSPS